MLCRKNTPHILSDCFFPEETNSGKRELGRSVIEKLIQDDPEEMRVREFLYKFDKLVTLDDELKEIVRNYAISSSRSEVNVGPVVNSIAKVSGVLGKDAAAKIAKESLGALQKFSTDDSRDYYGALERGL